MFYTLGEKVTFGENSQAKSGMLVQYMGASFPFDADEGLCIQRYIESWLVGCDNRVIRMDLPAVRAYLPEY